MRSWDVPKECSAPPGLGFCIDANHEVLADSHGVAVSGPGRLPCTDPGGDKPRAITTQGIVNERPKMRIIPGPEALRDAGPLGDSDQIRSFGGQSLLRAGDL